MFFSRKKASHACIQKLRKMFGFVDKPYTPEVEHSHCRMMVERLLSFWDGFFSSATLHFQGVFVEHPRCRKMVRNLDSTVIH